MLPFSVVPRAKTRVRFLQTPLIRSFVCSAVGDSEAGRWSHRSVEAGEAAVGSVSTDIIEDRDQWLEQGGTWQPIKD